MRSYKKLRENTIFRSPFTYHFVTGVFVTSDDFIDNNSDILKLKGPKQKEIREVIWYGEL